MKIKSVESFIGRLKLGIPLKMAGSLIESSDNLFVRIESDDGFVGWGEAASAPNMTGETAASMLGTARHIAPSIVGKNFSDATSFLDQLDKSIVGNNAAKSAIEMAFMDALARQSKVPLHQLLGKIQRTSVQALWMIAGQGGMTDAEQALEKYQEGWRCFKVKAGMESPAADAKRTIEVINALPKDAQISADANRGYQLQEALDYLQLVSNHGLAFFEQPINPKNDSQWKSLSTATEIPVGVDESLSSIEKLEHFIDAKLVHGGSFKTIKLGGVSRVYQACSIAAQAGFKINLACKVAETNIATSALLQIASVLPEISWGISLTNLYLQDEYTLNPPVFSGGVAVIPSGHGLGVDVNEEFLRSTKIDEAKLFQ
jgi:muconate cycloisomerase